MKSVISTEIILNLSLHITGFDFFSPTFETELFLKFKVTELNIPESNSNLIPFK